jgi:uncharacterized protein with HEPN domain
MRDDRERLRDIKDAIEQIEKYTSRGHAAFSANELLQIWVVHFLRIIGEACRALSEKIRENYPEIPWKEIIGFRNLLVHQYFGIDLDAIWDIVENDLPSLKNHIEGILAQKELE